MKYRYESRNLALIFSVVALLSFLGHTFIDYGYVFPEMGVSTSDVLPITVGVLAFYGGWLWALIAAGRNSRKGLVTLFVYNMMLLLFGISTFTTLCPSPCSTAWPTGEILMWSNVIIGFGATLLVAKHFRQPTQTFSS